MTNSENYILTIDVSSNKIKAALISESLKMGPHLSRSLKIINEDVDGFAKRFDMDDIWKKIKVAINEILQNRTENENIIGISSCAQRMAVVFVDHEGKAIYGGPNTDIRGIDSAYLIEDEFSEEELFQITGHSPSILFCLSRLLWFREEQEKLYDKINKVLMLDDWIVYKLTGEECSDLTSAGESQLLDIKQSNWSSEIIEAFDFNPDLFPDFIESGAIVGELKSELVKSFKIKQKSVPIIKTGGDTQATLLGMGVIEDGNIGISLGTTAPIHLVVNEPILDPKYNFWTTYHSVKGKWLIEGNSGNTGIVYDWLKNDLLVDKRNDKDNIIDNYLKEVKPGSDSTYAFLGPEFMNIKDQTSLKRGVFVFPPPTLITETLPNMKNFARSVIENICFGINENYRKLIKFSNFGVELYSAGGMAKSSEFIKILANILSQNIKVPQFKDSAFLGCAMNTLYGLKIYKNYRKIIDDLLEIEQFSFDDQISKEYKKIFKEWKNLKKRVNEL
ncbi:MAG: FGGY-family carbohydrate kinase [Candidatus Odinarchaeota archaeon]